MPRDHVKIHNVEVLIETKRGEENQGAIKIDVENEQIWIPKSQIHENSEVYAIDTYGTLIIPKWLAEEKGLI